MKQLFKLEQWSKYKLLFVNNSNQYHAKIIKAKVFDSRQIFLIFSRFVEKRWHTNNSNITKFAWKFIHDILLFLEERREQGRESYTLSIKEDSKHVV